MTITNISLKPQLKYFNFLCMLYITGLLAAVVVVYKVVSIGPLTISEGTLIFPITYFFGDIIAEVYGYELSRSLIWYSLICEIIFTFIVSHIIKLPPPPYWQHQAEYDFVLGNIMQVALANTIAVPTGAFLNAYAITKWKVLLKGRYFWIRSLASTAIGELAFCIIASPIVFIGMLSSNQVFTIVVSTYVIKLIFAVVSIFPANVIQYILKKAEGIDIYDTNTNFNPFKLEI